MSTDTPARAPHRARVVFMGTPDFAVPSLDALVAAGHEVICVYTQPARPAGRGQKLQPTPVAARAEALGIPVRTPATLRDPADRAAFADLGADIAVVAAYGLILPRPVLDAPAHGCINVHASLLPRWRGAAPIHRALLEGDAETGVTIMQMEAGLDTGPMLATCRVPIGPRMTAQELHDRLAADGAALLARTLPGVLDGSITAEPQPEAGVTYAKKLEKAEGRIDWTADAARIDRLVRAFTPWPGAFFDLEGESLRLIEAAPSDAAVPAGTVAGTLLADGRSVACGDGRALRLIRAQRAGRKPMTLDDLARGFPAVAPGARLG
ncbi:methionyl-tRNA formyltransferase [Tistrella mobilis]|uniref:Methionyl-tRNA formyltransferase n=1 Tax=Tistrella mobilis (strain KA081020-065) TaxID=1110502 RepID=I3TP49_TISMK|nr:methionyl-tRNA formyltransferase [Tistrella mobilis]AFK54537.1 methionyl-tRNA formyltransferase fmt [Tistrella mobilis KA081020-065]